MNSACGPPVDFGHHEPIVIIHAAKLAGAGDRLKSAGGSASTGGRSDLGSRGILLARRIR